LESADRADSEATAQAISSSPSPRPTLAPGSTTGRALLAAETMTGANDLRVYAMPLDRMLAAMKKYGRLP
jgi:hypothetical protein